jgi:hypothetical protein
MPWDLLPLSLSLSLSLSDRIESSMGSIARRDGWDGMDLDKDVELEVF